MAQDNEYVQKLIAARDREVTHRRDIAEALAEKHDRGDTENMREAFIKIQDVIEAIERAVWHRRPVRAVLVLRLRKLIQRINHRPIQFNSYPTILHADDGSPHADWFFERT